MWPHGQLRPNVVAMQPSLSSAKGGHTSILFLYTKIMNKESILHMSVFLKISRYNS
jgi:hypothetical protein